MKGAKSLAFHVGVLLLAFSAAHTAGTLFLRYERGATVPLGWLDLPDLDAAAFNLVVSGGIALPVWVVAAWHRRAKANEKRRAEDAAEQSGLALAAVRRGLQEAGLHVAPDQPSNRSKGVESRIDALESEIRQLQTQLSLERPR